MGPAIDQLSRRRFLGISATFIGSLPFLAWSPRAWAGLAPMAFWKKKTVSASSILPEGVDFDGADDYLLRSSDFVGNADSKTFTFSAWVWLKPNSDGSIYSNTSAYFDIAVRYSAGNPCIDIEGKNSGGSTVLSAITAGGTWAYNTWNHILISIDLSDANCRSIYINDQPVSTTWTTYTNSIIDLTRTSHMIANGSAVVSGRLAHIYLDYTYRDLSAAGSRRKFITADRKPALRGADGSDSVYGLYADSRLDSGLFGFSYDGTNSVTRASDLAGNTDGNSITLSFWINPKSANAQLLCNGNSRIVVNQTGNQIQLYCKDGADISIFNYTTTTLRRGCWNHVLMSFNLSNPAQCHIYVNGVAETFSGTFTNGVIDRAAAGTWTIGSTAYRGELAHFFLDYTYRDLTIAANRALFLSTDNKPASGQSSLSPILYLPLTNSAAMGSSSGTGGDFVANGSFAAAALNRPILYLPMSSPETAHVNSGTGGDFTLSGTVSRSGRGPNQFNVPFSDFDGVSDYLSSPNPIGSDSNALTIHCCFSTDTITSQKRIFAIYEGANIRLNLGHNASGSLIFEVWDTSNTITLYWFSSNFLVAQRNYILTLSIDLNSPSTRHIYLNGEAVAGTWNTYSGYFRTNCTPSYVGSGGSGNGVWDGRIGGLWVSQTYIDLSQNANRVKFVTGTGIDARPADLGANGELPTGSAPRIYLPLHAENAGKNFGTTGNFTAVSGPYAGARGPSEFWGNKVKYNGTTGYLDKAITGLPNDQAFALSLWFDAGTQDVFTLTGIDVYGDMYDIIDISTSTTTMSITCRQEYRSDGVYVKSGISINATRNHLLLSINPATDAIRCYVNGTAVGSFIVDTGRFVGTARVNKINIGRGVSEGVTPSYNYFNGTTSEAYFHLGYIDFSQESNRLKFRDPFGNPVDLGTDGSKPTGTIPLIYLRFDPSNFGKNSGSGGDFTVNGTLTDSGQL